MVIDWFLTFDVQSKITFVNNRNRLKAVVWLQKGNTGGLYDLVPTVKVRDVFLLIPLGVVGQTLTEMHRNEQNFPNRPQLLQEAGMSGLF